MTALPMPYIPLELGVRGSTQMVVDQLEDAVVRLSLTGPTGLEQLRDHPGRRLLGGDVRICHRRAQRGVRRGDRAEDDTLTTRRQRADPTNIAMYTSIDRFRFALALSVLGATLTVAPARADAQATDSIQACYVPLSGTIYRINAAKAPNACTRPEHVKFSLGTGSNAKGPGGGGGGGTGGTTTDHGTLAGLADDDHPQYLLADGVRNSTNGFAVAGSQAVGTIPASGAGIRLMWYPGKAAFRAGAVSGDQWDDANIGLGSIALGMHTKATANASLALGNGSQALGLSSAAMGSGALASGLASSALGRDALSSEFSSAALGTMAKATGESGVALGYMSNAAGFASAALGGGTANASHSVAIKGSATGISAIAIGSYTDASGQMSMALGHQASTNQKNGAIVIGDNSTDTPVRAQIDNHFVVRAARLWFGNNNNSTATVGRFIETSTGAYLSSGGTWVSSSDSAKKHRWQNVDGEDVLAKLSTIPLRTWSYREEPDSVRHLGPTAQEFRAAFGLGDTDKAIATVDADGVALVAAQTLDRRTRVLMDEITALRAELAALRAELETLRR